MVRDRLYLWTRLKQLFNFRESESTRGCSIQSANLCSFACHILLWSETDGRPSAFLWGCAMNVSQIGRIIHPSPRELFRSEFCRSKIDIKFGAGQISSIQIGVAEITAIERCIRHIAQFGRSEVAAFKQSMAQAITTQIQLGEIDTLESGRAVWSAGIEPPLVCYQPSNFIAARYLHINL